MKKSIYLNFALISADDEYNHLAQSYIELYYDKVLLMIPDFRSVAFYDRLCASFNVEPDSFTLYIPQRGDGFTFHAVKNHDIVPLLNDNVKAVQSLFLSMESTIEIDEQLPDLVRFILHLMSDRQIRDNFSKLYPIYHGFRSINFTR